MLSPNTQKLDSIIKAMPESDQYKGISMIAFSLVLDSTSPKEQKLDMLTRVGEFIEKNAVAETLGLIPDPRTKVLANMALQNAQRIGEKLALLLEGLEFPEK